MAEPSHRSASLARTPPSLLTRQRQVPQQLTLLLCQAPQQLTLLLLCQVPQQLTLLYRPRRYMLYAARASTSGSASSARHWSRLTHLGPHLRSAAS